MASSLLAGEAGGGKTRLVRELALEAAARGVLVLYGAPDAVVSTPYQPLREWLEFLLRVVRPRVAGGMCRRSRPSCSPGWCPSSSSSAGTHAPPGDPSPTATCCRARQRTCSAG